MDILLKAPSWGLRAYLVVIAIVVAPVAEGFLFRGVLFPYLKSLGYPKLAWLAPSFVFALIHVNLPTFIPLFVLALALARCLNDMAAMAGTPTAALITLALPQEFDADHVARIYDGLNELAQATGVAIVGGETTTNPGRMLISVALLGTVPRGRQILRSGAKAGDAIFVTGELGGSLAGKHLEFAPRLAEARWLAEHFDVHALMDLSDGLAGDLPHILRASGVGAELLKTAVPISRAAKLRAAEKPPFVAALTDGEDFELLFTLAAKDAVKLADGWKQAFPAVKLSCIGRIIDGAGVLIRDRNGILPLKSGGYVHFAA